MRMTSWRRPGLPSLAPMALEAMALAAIILTSACAGKDVGTDPGPTPSISLQLASSSASLAQGGSGTVAVTVARDGGYAGAVDLTVDGAPPGVTATLNPSMLDAGVDASTLTLSVSPTAATTGSPANLTVHAAGTGVATRTQTVALSVTPGATFGFSLAPTGVSVVQGGNGSVTGTITREAGFTGE